jgi:hypothetical protein
VEYRTFARLVVSAVVGRKKTAHLIVIGGIELYIWGGWWITTVHPVVIG